MELGEAEAILSDIVSKHIRKPEFAQTTERVGSGRHKIIRVSSDGDELFSERLLVLKEFFEDLPPIGYSVDFLSTLTSELANLSPKSRLKTGSFHVEASSDFQRLLFALWIELVTGIGLRESFGIKKDVLFEVGTNYRFPVSSLSLISTKNMIRALSKSVLLIITGSTLITWNLESKAIALLLSVAVPRTKGNIVVRGSESFLGRIL